MVDGPGRGAATASPRSLGTVALPAQGGPAARIAAAPDVPKGTGPVRNGTFFSVPLSDTLLVQVNVGSGNLLLRSRDLTLPGLGDDVELGATYNSLLAGSAAGAGAFGPGWSTGTGTDERLIAADDGTVTYLTGDGVAGVFTPTSSGASTYTSPGEFKAKLTKVTGTGWTLQENGGRKLTFTTAGRLDKWADRNGNTTDLELGGDGRETAVVSTRGGSGARRAAVEWTGAGQLAAYRQSGDDGTTRAATYTYAGGRLSGITHPTTRAAHFGYSSAGDLTSITLTAGWGGSQRTTVTYDSAHRVTSLTRVTDAGTGAGATTRFAYPSATQSLVADANTDLSLPVTSVARTTYTVDASKRITAVKDPAGNTRSATYTPFQDVLTATSAEGGSVTNTYGANGGQSLTASFPSTGASAGGSTVTYGNAGTTTNPTAGFQRSADKDRQGNSSSYTYNGAGNRLSVADASAATPKVTYNADGTVATSTDPANGTNATRYQVNTTSKQVTGITPVTGTSLGARDFTYDAFGRLRTASDGAGRTVTYGYDTDDRLIDVDYSDGTDGVVFAYDAYGNLYQRDDAAGVVYLDHDPLNRLTRRAATTGGGDLAYGYDPVGNLTSLTDGRGTTTYSYDSRNLLTTMETATGARYAFEYDKDGRRTATYFDTNTAKTAWAARTVTTYDKTGRLGRISTVRDSGAQTTVSDVSTCYTPFSYNGSCSAPAADRDLVQWDYNHLTATRSDFTYDKGNRLTGATNYGGASWSYTYDANGFRRTVVRSGTTTQTLTPNAANQVTNSGNTFDGAGNQLAGAGSGGPALVWNAAGQMVEAGGTPFVYAGLGQDEFITTATADLVYGRSGTTGLPWIQSYRQYYSDGDYTQGYVERDPTGQPLGLTIDGESYYLVTDRQGSVVGLVDRDGAEQAKYVYDPYGGLVSSSGDHAEDNPLRYTGAFQDNLWGLGTQLTKLGTRWYNPFQGRFVQQDPITRLLDPSEGNRYAYAADNPVNYVDPTGRAIAKCEASEKLVGWGVGLGLGVIGGAIGSAVGPAGTIAGVSAGAAAGAVIGQRIGAGFGGAAKEACVQNASGRKSLDRGNVLEEAVYAAVPDIPFL